MTKMVIGGSQSREKYSEVTILPQEGAAVAYNYTFLPWTDGSVILLSHLLLAPKTRYQKLSDDRLKTSIHISHTYITQPILANIESSKRYEDIGKGAFVNDLSL